MESLFDNALDEIMGIIHRNCSNSADDESCIQTLEGSTRNLKHRAAAYRKFVDAIDARVEHDILALARQRNGLVPIHRLPPELLSTLFAIVIDPASQDPKWKNERTALVRLRRLTSTCAAWRKLASSIPSLWSTLDVSDPALMISKALGLSGNRKLNITTASQGQNDSNNKQGLQRTRLLQLALPHRQRWKSVNFVLSSSLTYFPMLTSDAAPSMDTFIVQAAYMRPTPSYTIPIDLFQGKAGSLKHVDICFPILWDTGVLSNLRSLALKGINSHGPSVAQMRNLLGSNPRLKALTLRDVRIVHQVDNQADDTIHLPELELLDLSLSPDDLRAVLGLIRTSDDLSNFKLGIKGRRGEELAMNPTFQIATPFLKAFCRGHGHCGGGIRLHIGGERSHISLNAHKNPLHSDDLDTTSFSIHFTPASPNPALLWVLSGVDTLPAEWKATVSLDIMDEYIFDALKKIDMRVTTLCFNLDYLTPRTMIGKFLEYLAEPTVPGGSWPLPMLANFSVSCGSIIQTTLRSMVEKRYQGVNGPRKLQSLNISSNYETQVVLIDRKTRNEISAMLGDATVLFDGFAADEVRDGDSDGSCEE